MTRIFDDNGSVVPVSVIEAGPCFVTQLAPRQDGYTPSSSASASKARQTSRTRATSSTLAARAAAPEHCARSASTTRRATSSAQQIDVSMFAAGRNRRRHRHVQGQGLRRRRSSATTSSGGPEDPRSDRLPRSRARSARARRRAAFKGMQDGGPHGRRAGDRQELRSCGSIPSATWSSSRARSRARATAC